MMNGCAVSTPVCLQQPKQQIKQPESFAMQPPEHYQAMPYKPSNGDALEVLVNNNKSAETDKAKLVYLQKYVSELLTNLNKNNN